MMVYSPGPMTLFIMANGIKMQYRQIYPVLIGANHAYLLSIIIFSFGLAGLLRSNELLLKSIQILGIIYLLFLSFKQWTKKINVTSELNFDKETKKSALYTKGVLIALSNPKTILLFSVIFPQFVTADHNYYVQIAILGSTFLALQFSSGCFYAYFGQAIKKYLDKPKHNRLINQISAIVLLLVAAFLMTKFGSK